MSTPEAPSRGPCSDWITGEDVAAVCTALTVSGDADEVYGEFATTASEILWELSGRQFSGLCERTVRPCVSSCGCWPDIFGTWYGAWDPYLGAWLGYYPLTMSGPAGRNCCGCLSEVKLAGYPVRQVTEVLIDGAAIDASNYRVDQNKWLVYLNDADGNPQVWPACQDLAAPDTEQGTFAVTYTYGVDPPSAGQLAAAELACQIATSASGGECALPPGTTKVTRQGITVDLTMLQTALLGLPLVSLFLATYNPAGLRRRAALWSPDIAPYARTVGQ